MVFLTTLTCMVEYAFWDVPRQQKIDMTTLYGPYLALCESHRGTFNILIEVMLIVSQRRI